MDGEEIFDTVTVSGSANLKFSSGVLKHDDIKQENFDGWLAIAVIYSS